MFSPSKPNTSAYVCFACRSHGTQIPPHPGCDFWSQPRYIYLHVLANLVRAVGCRCFLSALLSPLAQVFRARPGARGAAKTEELILPRTGMNHRGEWLHLGLMCFKGCIQCIDFRWMDSCHNTERRALRVEWMIVGDLTGRIRV